MSNKHDPVSVVAYWWNDPEAKHKGTYEFTAKHVNKLARAFERHLTVPHQFVCIGDDTAGLDLSVVRFVPIPDEFRDIGRCFARLRNFSPAMKDLLKTEHAVFVDLDVAILGNVDFLFERNESFEGYRDTFVGYRDSMNPRCYSGALYRMKLGAHTEVYDGFKRFYEMFPKAHRKAVFQSEWNRNSPYVGSDQSWIVTALGENNYRKFGQKDGIWDYWSVECLGDVLPKDARMVFLNGMRRDASMSSLQNGHKWLRDYWND